MKKIIVYMLILGVVMGCSNDIDNLNLSGKLYMKGSTPHTYLVIEDTNTHKNYKIENPKEFNLLYKQNKIIKVKAKLVKKAISSSFPAIIEVLSIKK